MNEPKCTQYNLCEYRLEPASPCMLHVYYKCKHFDFKIWDAQNKLEAKVECLGDKQ